MTPSAAIEKRFTLRRAAAAFVVIALGAWVAPARAGAGHDHGHAKAAAPRASLAEGAAALRHARAALPRAPAGVTDVAFADFFEPIGEGGLSYSEKLRGLDGRPVRLLGYMVRQDEPIPGTILLAPFPFQLHETEYGLAEDLPPTLVHVRVPDQADAIVPFTPGVLLLTGDLALGPREEPDGRISTVRLTLHPRPSSHPAKHKEKKR